MQPIIKRRRENVRRLIRDRFSGSQTSFAEAAKVSLSQLGQWLAAEDSPHIRNMTERSARKIEGNLGLEPGALDLLPSDGAVQADTKKEGLTLVPAPSQTVTIHQYETGGRMGAAGVVLRDQPGVIESWRVSREWLDKNVRGYSSAGKLYIVTGFGDSMRPMFNPGDPLIVDGGVASVEFDAVYFFRVGEEGFIKRLQRIPGKGLMAISENKAYVDWVIEPTMDFEVFGRVLKVWRSEDF